VRKVREPETASPALGTSALPDSFHQRLPVALREAGDPWLSSKNSLTKSEARRKSVVLTLLHEINRHANS